MKFKIRNTEEGNYQFVISLNQKPSNIFILITVKP